MSDSKSASKFGAADIIRLGVISVSAMAIGASALASQTVDPFICLCEHTIVSCRSMGNHTGQVIRTQCDTCAHESIICCDFADQGITGAHADYFDCGMGCSYNYRGTFVADFVYCS